MTTSPGARLPLTIQMASAVTDKWITQPDLIAQFLETHAIEQIEYALASLLRQHVLMRMGGFIRLMPPVQPDPEPTDFTKKQSAAVKAAWVRRKAEGPSQHPRAVRRRENSAGG